MWTVMGGSGSITHLAGIHYHWLTEWQQGSVCTESFQNCLFGIAHNLFLSLVPGCAKWVSAQCKFLLVLWDDVLMRLLWASLDIILWRYLTSINTSKSYVRIGYLFLMINSWAGANRKPKSVPQSPFQKSNQNVFLWIPNSFSQFSFSFSNAYIEICFSAARNIAMASCNH